VVGVPDGPGFPCVLHLNDHVLHSPHLDNVPRLCV
jgi:hypothetical protein